jgi:hypothetical protein
MRRTATMEARVVGLVRIRGSGWRIEAAW